MAFLGDRVKIHSIAMEGNEVLVDMTSHGPTDNMCCPSQRAIRRYVVENDKLIAASHEKPDASQQIVHTVWKWQQTLENNDTKAVPSDPDQYTLTFLPGGQISIRADCNQGGGIYTLNASRLTIEITHTTMAACPPGSLEQKYIRYLNAVAGFFIKGDALYLDIKYDTGTMTFSK